MKKKVEIKIVATDVDGVIFDVSSSWREFHKRLGTLNLERLERLRSLYLEGKISYLEWAKEEVKVWKGIKYEEFVKIVESFPWVEGANEVFPNLKRKDYYLIAVSSGGIKRAVKKRLESLGFDEIYSNDLEEKDGIVTGNFICEVEHEKKHKVIEKVLKRKNLSWKEVAVIGDDINDELMLRNAGLRIVFRPKSKYLLNFADYVIYDLRKLLEIL